MHPHSPSASSGVHSQPTPVVEKKAELNACTPHLPHTTNTTEQVIRVRFYLPAYPFLRPSFFQITTGTTRTDTAHPDTMTDGTATAVIEVTETGIVMTGATGTEDTTATAIDETTTGVLEGTREDGGIDENAKRGLV